jgi:hypothetical protein
MAQSRAAARAAAALACAAVATVALAVAASSPAAAPATAAQLVRTAVADAKAMGSVHITASLHATGRSGTLTSDVARTEGRQDFAFSSGAQAHVLLLDQLVFFSGNRAAMLHYFDLPTAVVREVGDHWVSVPPTNAGYAMLAAGVTLPSALAEITPTGRLTETAPLRIDGAAAIGIRGQAPAASGGHGTEVMYVTRGGRPLPLTVASHLEFTGEPSSTATTTLSHWGERVSLRAPTGVFPAAGL